MTEYLITGSKGFIGTNLTKRLKSNYKIIDLAAKPSIDITKPLPNIHAETLVHLAAFTNVRTSMKNPAKCMTTNLLGTLNCLELARKNKFKKFIFASSIGARKPFTPYTASKAMGEVLCRAYNRTYGLNTISLVLANIYGPYSLHKTSAVHQFIKSILKKEPIKVFGDGSQTRDFVYVSDVVDTIINTYMENSVSVSTGVQISINEILAILTKISEVNLKYIPEITYTRPIKGELKSVKTEPNIFPYIKIKDGLKRTFCWYLRNFNGA